MQTFINVAAIASFVLSVAGFLYSLNDFLTRPENPDLD